MATVGTTTTNTITNMATPSDNRGLLKAVSCLLARAFICLLGLGAVAWGGWVLPLFWHQASLNQIASESLQGHVFKTQVLLDEARRVEAFEPTALCDPIKLHSAVVVRLAISDSAIAAANQASVESAHAAFYDLARRALACAPTDSFVWLTLFWLDATKNGLTPENANYLRLSYAVGPNEGWIALWRVRLAFALFGRLPRDLSRDALNDFINLVDTSALYAETAAVFASAAPAVQSEIIQHLKTANATSRQVFARVLYDQGMNVKIPDTVILGLRPWEH
jgi:hypothetical protein